MSGLETIIWVRHVVTPWNREGRLQGSIDVEPTNEDIASWVAEKSTQFCEHNVECLLTSPLARARRGAEIIAQQLGIPVQVEDGLTEVHFGSREGTVIAALPQSQMSEIVTWLRQPWAGDLVGAEKYRLVEARQKKVLNGLPTRYRTVGIVGHTASSVSLEAICGDRGIRFVRLVGTLAPSDIANRLRPER